MTRLHADVAAEKTVLGGAILDREIAIEVCALLRAGDFYNDRHALVYEALSAQLQADRPTDTLGLRGALESGGKLSRVGGDEFLLALTDTIPTLANVTAHAQRVRELATLRAALDAMRDVLREAEEGVDDVNDFLSRAEGTVSRATQARALTSEPVLLATAVDEVFAQVIDRAEGKHLGHRTGFLKFDEYLGGMVPGEVIALGGRPGMGKTSFALQLALGVERNSTMPVLFQSIEMPRVQLAMRALAAESMVDGQKIRDAARLSRGDMDELREAGARLSRQRVWVDDCGSVTVADIALKARRVKRQHGLAMLVVDYLQLIRSASRSESREEAVGETSRGLRALAKELGIPVLALVSLNRKCEERGKDKRPMISDIRESGTIESDADTVLLLYRDEVYNAESDDRSVAEVIIGKQRNGPTGTIRLRFDSSRTRFDNLEDMRREDYA